MIQVFVDAYMNGKDALRAEFARGHPEDYKAIVAAVVRLLAGTASHDAPDPDRIHQIDGDAYSGTMVFVIAGKGYGTSSFWYVRVYYGSCPGCDTLEAIKGYTDEPPNAEQVDGYMTLALHIVQGLKPMSGDPA